MTATDTRSTPVRAQGQWALGHREPLNPNERMKRDSDGLEVRQRIIDIYQYTGFDGIDGADLRGRFRWMGLYTQRAQGIPGGRTAVLEPEELEDRFFMLRVRIDDFLAPGRLPDIAVRAAGGPVTAPIGDTSFVAELVVQRYREAVAGRAVMNCDCCTYRTPWPGRETKVGQPQEVHEHPADP